MKERKNSPINKGTSNFVRGNKGVSERPINKHGNYDGTDVGFTSNSIQDAATKASFAKTKKKVPRPIDKHGNYDGTDVGFTSGSLSHESDED